MVGKRFNFTLAKLDRKKDRIYKKIANITLKINDVFLFLTHINKKLPVWEKKLKFLFLKKLQKKETFYLAKFNTLVASKCNKTISKKRVRF